MSRKLVIYADGGSRGNPGQAAYGALVCQGDEVLVEISERIGIATNNVAEYQGLIAGIKAAHRIDPQAHIEARLDSKLIVEQMSGRWKIKSVPIARLAMQAKTIHPAQLITFTWIPREENYRADSLVNLALDTL
ncbi:MAG: reverse transcriptase-like protein [Phycisphaerae bacterium]|nr:reverse transcriptase-like protein [Actinomycetota bacterium]MBM4101046.1 reverse transcriptase-like protein [Phycisphaerae bacterium]